MWEELDIEPLTRATYMGTIRDITSSTNDHFGLVFNVKAQEGLVTIKETDKLVGEWMTYQELFDNYSKFENWSKYIIDHFYETSVKNT
jgi:predicted NUDIX family phosphoesterase